MWLHTFFNWMNSFLEFFTLIHTWGWRWYLLHSLTFLLNKNYYSKWNRILFFSLNSHTSFFYFFLSSSHSINIFIYSQLLFYMCIRYVFNFEHCRNKKLNYWFIHIKIILYSTISTLRDLLPQLKNKIHLFNLSLSFIFSFNSDLIRYISFQYSHVFYLIHLKIFLSHINFFYVINSLSSLYFLSFWFLHSTINFTQLEEKAMRMW